MGNAISNFMIILFTAIIAENFVLTKFLGICPFLGVSKKTGSAFGMSCAVIFVMLMATAVTYPVYKQFLVPFKLEYLNKIVFILIIALFVQLVEIVLKRFIPSLYKSLGVYLPLITTNCAVLGVTLLHLEKDYTYLQSLFNALGAGFGFMLAIVLFSGVRSRMENTSIPKAFKGMPSALIAASILAISFKGFGGIVENLFR